MRNRIRLLSLILIVALVFSFTGCKAITSETTAEKAEAETTTQPVQENGEYNIGDIGPAGGLIFYLF